MPQGSARAGRLALVALVMALGSAVFAGVAGLVRRDDRADQALVDLAAEPAFSGVAQMRFVSSSGSSLLQGGATYLGGGWFISAAHLLDDAAGTDRFRVRVGGVDYQVVEKQIHPAWNNDFVAGNDVALVRVAETFPGLPRLDLYRGERSGLVGVEATIVGFGLGGTGSAGANEGRRRRAGTNVLDVFGQVVFSDGSGGMVTLGDTVGMADFDNPGGAGNTLAGFGSSPSPTDLEVSAATNDSGGPALVLVDGHWRVAGISSFVAGVGGVQFGYGSLLGVTSVPDYAAWIDAQTRLCRADFDDDLDADARDVVGFIDAYRRGDPAADFDLDGAVGAMDLIGFVQAFRGCQ